MDIFFFSSLCILLFPQFYWSRRGSVLEQCHLGQQKYSSKIFTHHFSGVSSLDLPLLPLLSILHIYFSYGSVVGVAVRVIVIVIPLRPFESGRARNLCEIWPVAKFPSCLAILHFIRRSTFFFFWVHVYINTSTYPYVHTYKPMLHHTLFSYIVIFKRNNRKTCQYSPERRKS